MYSLSARLNSIFFFTAFVLVALSGLNILTSKLNQVREAKVDFKVTQINAFNVADLTRYDTPGTPREGRLWEEVSFNFTLNTDLTPLFNWNVKQLFFYATITYKDNKGRKSESTFFDLIVPRDQTNKPYILNFANELDEYFLTDVYSTLRGQEVEFNFYVEIMPIVGYIERTNLNAPVKYRLPDTYTSTRARRKQPQQGPKYFKRPQ